LDELSLFLFDYGRATFHEELTTKIIDLQDQFQGRLKKDDHKIHSPSKSIGWKSTKM
jgi:hypothetical protein